MLRHLDCICDIWSIVMKYISSIWYPSADQWNRTASAWVAVTDQFWDFANNFENYPTITNEISLESLESKSYHSTICNRYLPVFLCPVFFYTIHPKLVKAAANELAQPIFSSMNMSLSLSCFLHELKTNQRHLLYTKARTILSLTIIAHWVFLPVCPFFNGSMMIKWVCILKIYCLYYYLHFVKRYGCHPVLTKLMESSKQALDEGKMLDLSC